MERGIARCRVLLSLIAIVTLYVDPLEPSLTRWLPLTGGAFTVNRYWAGVLIAHLIYSVGLYDLHTEQRLSATLLAKIATWGDVLFAAAIALVTEGVTSPFYSFFAFAVLATGMRTGRRSAIVVTGVSVLLYALIIIMSAPSNENFLVVMRAAYIAITGYLVGYLGQERIDQETRIRQLETSAQREQIARSLHDGYAQSLAAVSWRLSTCRELLADGSNEDVDQELAELQTGVNREQDELRGYIRSLVDMDAGAAMPSDPRQGPRVSVTTDFHGSAMFVEHVLSILLEGTRNVRRHAGATSAIILARSAAGELTVSLDDDGVGFAPGAPPPWSITSRVAECGGRLVIANDATAGSHVRIHLPEG
jgi:signal transduction histidine kinase